MTSHRESFVWRAGVIAAGHGERLRPHVGALKPLVPVSGQTLIERVLWSLAEARPAEVVIIVNEESTEVRDVVASGQWPFAVRWIVETTPSSMHSFLRVVETLAGSGSAGPFLISTVDTVALPGTFRAFADQALAYDADLALAVHRVRDDDKPLLVRVDDHHRVTAIGTSVRPDQDASHVFATAGYYAVRASVLEQAGDARADRLTALRLFLGRLVTRGYRLAAVPVESGVDVDRPADVAAAEAFLKQVRA